MWGHPRPAMEGGSPPPLPMEVWVLELRVPGSGTVAPFILKVCSSRWAVGTADLLQDPHDERVSVWSPPIFLSPFCWPSSWPFGDLLGRPSAS